MKYLKFATGVIAGVALAAAMAFGVYTAQAQNTLLGPVATSTALTGTTAAQVIGQNASRKDIRICNVGTTVVWIWPGPLTPVVSAYELPALSSGTTICFTPPDGSVGPGAAGQGNSWNAQSVGSGGQISAIEWF
jgi:hypothetical protein